MERETITAPSAAGKNSETAAFSKAAASSQTKSFAAEAIDWEVLRTPPPARPKPVNYLHSLVAIPLIYLYTIVMGSLSLTLSLYDPGGRRQHWCARTWCRLISANRDGTGARLRRGAHKAGHVLRFSLHAPELHGYSEDARIPARAASHSGKEDSLSHSLHGLAPVAGRAHTH